MRASYANHCGFCWSGVDPNFAPFRWRIWLAFSEFLCLLANQNVTVVTLFCTKLPFFCTVLPKNCISLGQSQSRNFFMYIIKSVIDSAVWHWTTRLMVFPRNAIFGRCYLGSTRHEILSNIDRNLTGTRQRLRKNLNTNKSRESTNPIPVLLLSLESQTLTVVFELFDFQQRKFNEKRFYFHNHMPTVAPNLKFYNGFREGQWREQN